MLKKVRPFITEFSSSGDINDLATNDICVATGFAGDVGMAHRRRSQTFIRHQRFSNANEGGLLAFDVMVIQNDAPHPQGALRSFDYIENPKVNAAITNEVFDPAGSDRVPA